MPAREAIAASSCKKSFVVLTALAVLAACGCGLRPVPKEQARPNAAATPVLETVEAEKPSLPVGRVDVGQAPSRSNRTGSGSVTTEAVASRDFQRLISRPVAPETGSEIQELARSLVAGKVSEREKAHALYRWLGENIAYNVEGLYSGDLGDNSPEAVLKNRIAVCAGYARTFDAMCEEVGLESEMVVGRIGSDGAELPPSLRDSETNHAWNAVKIDGSWHLLDPTWGAGHVTEARNFVRNPNDEWFMVEPSAFIYSHLPSDPKWQLLSNPVSAQVFENLPDIRPQFFSLGMELVEPLSGSIECDGEAVFEVRNSDESVLSAQARQNGSWLPDDTHFSTREAGNTRMVVRFPQPGQYQVHLLVSKPEERESRSVATFEVTARRGTTASFPKTYLTYKQYGCELLEPLNGDLPAGRETRFKVRIPGGQGAWVRNGDKVVPMQSQGDIFTLDFVPSQGEVAVAGSFEEGSPRMWSLLQYEVE